MILDNPIIALIYLSRTVSASKILWDYDLLSWDMGGCAIFAQAVKYTLKIINIQSSLYVLIRPDSSIDHFLIYVPEFNLFFDSEGWYTINQVINHFIIMYNNPNISLVPWDSKTMNLGNIICPIDAINRSKRFFKFYIDKPFTIIHTEDEINLLSYDDNKIFLDDKEINYQDLSNLFPDEVLNQIDKSSQIYIETDID